MSDCPSFSLHETLRFQGTAITDYMVSAALGPLVLLDLRFNEDDNQLAKALLTFKSNADGAAASDVLDNDPTPSVVDNLLATIDAGVLDRSPISGYRTPALFGAPSKLPSGIQCNLWRFTQDFELPDHLEYSALFDRKPPPTDISWHFDEADPVHFMVFNENGFVAIIHQNGQSRNKALREVLDANLLVKFDAAIATSKDDVIARPLAKGYKPQRKAILAPREAQRLLGKSAVDKALQKRYGWLLTQLGREQELLPSDNKLAVEKLKHAQEEYVAFITSGTGGTLASERQLSYVRDIYRITGRELGFDLLKATARQAAHYITRNKAEFNRLKQGAR